MAATLIVLIFITLVILYFYLTRKYKYWEERGIPCAKGVLPVFGHVLPLLLMKKGHSNFFREMYHDNKDSSMVGFYNFMSPSLIVRDPELVKAVLQTKFTSFHENNVKPDPEADPLLSHNPFVTYGEKWITGRKRFTYAFSSMRLKILLESVRSACETLDSYLDRKLDKSGKIEVELKDLFSRYTAQVVASAGFGVDGFCFDDEEHKMSFRNLGNAILEPSTTNILKLMVIFVVPSLNKIFKVGLVPQYVDRFFRTLVADLMEKRRTEGIHRNDFLQLMADLEKMEGDNFDLEILASHALSFVVDGYGTSSSALSFVGYQLAAHSAVQEKLRKEVTTVLAKYDGKITYEALREMTYMDQVINESQRIMPMGGALTKLCTEETELRGSDGLACRVQPGTEIILSIHGLHEDAEYWSDPKRFDPERFAPDRKNDIDKFVFLPFGEGPRICVGMRMALLQMKACLAAVLKKYSLQLSPKTRVPLEMITGALLPSPKGGLWVSIQRLQS